MNGFEGPVGGALASTMEEVFTGAMRSSFRALGPVGGGLPVTDPTSLIKAVLLGTEPKEGAAGATGGGETSLAVVGGSWDVLSSFGRVSRSRASRSSLGSRGRRSASGYLFSRSRSSLSRKRPS